METIRRTFNISSTYKYLIALTVLSIFPVTAFAQNSMYDKIEDVEYYLDAQHDLKIDSIKKAGDKLTWEKSSKRIGYTRANVWARFKIPEDYREKNSNSSEKYLLIFDVVNKHWPHFIFLYEDSLKPQKRGAAYFSEQPQGYLQPTFNISMSEGYKYVRLMSHGPVKINLLIAKDTTVRAADATKTALSFMFIGILLITIVYNLTIYFRFMDRVYIYFGMYVFSIILFEDATQHIMSLVLGLRHTDTVSTYKVNFAVLLLSGVMIGFCRTYLSLIKYSKILDRVAASVQYMAFLLIPLTILSTNPFFIKLVNIPVAIAPILSIVISTILLKELKEARIFLAIVSLGLFAMTMRHLEFSGVISFDGWGFVYYSAHIVQSLFFSYGLSGRITKLQVAKQTAELEQVKQSTLNASLREMDKHKTMFFQRVSHELRTPLTLIMNPIETELEANPENNNLNVAFNNSQRLYRLVTQVLDYEKSKETNYLEMKSIDIVEFLKKTCGFVRPTCEKKGIMFALELNGYDDVQVMGTLDHLEKILFNFLSNALKYTPEQGRIKVQLDEFEGDVRVSVVDSGTGIAEDQQDKLFKEFSRVEDSAANHVDGTGLGLALVKELAEELGGKVGVESDEGFGCKFWVTFKRNKSRKNIIDIVFVDDELNIRDLIELYMTEKVDEIDFEVVESAKEVRKLLENNIVKTVVSDALMPDESGIELLSFIAKQYPETLRILMSGNTNVASMKDVIDANIVQKVYTKPINFEEVIKCISEHHKDDYARANLDSTEYDLKGYKPRGWHLEESNEDDIASELEMNKVEYEKSNGKLVLVIDDMADMRALIASNLKVHGNRVITARNAIEGLKGIEKFSPDLIIVDWMMPIMSGPELVEKLRNDERNASIPVIMLTAKSDRESQIAGAQSGANAYLGKPFNGIELSSLVNNLLKLKDSEIKVIELNNHLKDNVLKRFLPQQLVEDVLQGKKMIDEKPNVMPVTVLFADICDFTGKSFELGPIKMLEILNQYMGAMNKIIFKHGGTIDKFVGDSIMVLFGAPVGSSSVEQINAAMGCVAEMGEALDELNDRWLQEGYPVFEIRIGLHHGPAVVGYVGSEERTDYTALGGTVNIASRIESVAEPGTVFFSETVRDLMEDIEWMKAGQFDLKNVEGRVTLYKLPLSKKEKAA